MEKPTVRDIAREAGVSLSTVDRVLNERTGVRPRNAERVKAAVQKLGYVRDTHAANLARRRVYNFVFVLPEGSNQFVDTLRGALKEASASQLTDRVSMTIKSVDAEDPHAVVSSLQVLNRHHVDGVGLMVPETPQVRDAIARLKENGVAVVALVSDLPHSECDHFVGVDNLAAGRTAGVLLGRFVKASYGSILVVTNSLGSRDSLERRLGLDEVIASDFPSLRTLPTVEFHGDVERLSEVILSALRAHPDLVGVYSMGPGNGRLLDALRTCGKLRDLVVVAHELTPTTKQALRHNEIDAVIAQNVGHLARSALRVLRAKCDDVQIFMAQEQIRIDIIMRENLR
ncbi:MAG: LacI family DNA-binding transcriptional regulator [Pseudomonadota bacterium]